LVEEDQTSLNVEFLERVFMKSATSYKAAHYEDTSFEAGFWKGRAIDKQIGGSEVRLSNYWISEFLKSDFRTTSALGTRRLGVALREAARKSSDLSVKSEIAAVVTLASGLNGESFSIDQFQDRFGLSDAAKNAIRNELTDPRLSSEQFEFNLEEFKLQVPYRSVELDTGVVLSAHSGEFEEVFSREVIDDAGQIVRFSTEGKVITEKLGKAK